MGYYFETKDLSVGYHGTPLIKNISVGIERGEIVTLIGPNGSGKSTILKSITRHLATISGVVSLEQQDMNTITYKDLASKVAVVLTERIRPELMTCRDVVASGRYPYTNRLGVLTEEDEHIINETMEQIHILDLAGRDFSAISDGQRQRVLLARAICQQPEIIVLDEPTSFLDIRHKVELLSILRTMARKNHTTVIMSLHEIDLAQKVSDKVLCVKGDHIASFGTPEEIFRDQVIADLYEINEETFNLTFGSVELARPEGDVHTFVISSGGSGVDTFRKLQREEIPFYAGVLYTNDMDYPVARALAAQVVTEQPFEPISDGALEQAKQLIDQCDRVLVCDPVIGTMNAGLRELIRYAEEQQKVQK